MNIHIETPRLILRELQPEDAEALFIMDSNPEVHRYLGDPILTHIDQAIETIARVQKQYLDFGIGRWAVVERSSGKMIGWSGLKYVDKPFYHTRADYYDVGYRFQPQYWGKGYATETAQAALEYAFMKMQLPKVCATADMNNLASRRVLEKAGLKHIEILDDDGYAVAWLEITKEEWLQYRGTGKARII